MKQATFFADLEAARSTGHEAAERCADRADRHHPGWIEEAVAALRTFARNQPLLFTIEQAREVIGNEVAEPSDKRAWGQCTRLAIKREFIKRVPGATAPAASSHASPKPMYRRGPKA
jgi:hypothetical protein